MSRLHFYPKNDHFSTIIFPQIVHGLASSIARTPVSRRPSSLPRRTTDLWSSRSIAIWRPGVDPELGSERALLDVPLLREPPLPAVPAPQETLGGEEMSSSFHSPLHLVSA